MALAVLSDRIGRPPVEKGVIERVLRGARHPCEPLQKIHNLSMDAREQLADHTGALVLEFGASWCGFCRAARPLVERARAAHPGVDYRWEEDGRGKPLGRSFSVKLWPTLIFLRDGKEVARVVRPASSAELDHAYDTLGKS